MGVDTSRSGILGKGGEWCSGSQGLTRKAVLKVPSSGFKSQPCSISSIWPNVESGGKL